MFDFPQKSLFFKKQRLSKNGKTLCKIRPKLSNNNLKISRIFKIQEKRSLGVRFFTKFNTIWWVNANHIAASKY